MFGTISSYTTLFVIRSPSDYKVSPPINVICSVYSPTPAMANLKAVTAKTFGQTIRQSTIIAFIAISACIYGSCPYCSYEAGI